MIAATFQSLLQAFFTDRLLRQRQASPHTIAGYRDTFRLLFRFAADQLGKTPSTLNTEDFQSAFIGRFLPPGIAVRCRTRLGGLFHYYHRAA